MPRPTRLSLRDRRSLARTIQPPPPLTNGFAAVHVVQPTLTVNASLVEVIAGGVTVRVAVGCDPQWLAELAAHLHLRCAPC
jgi:hypothetical protein